MGETGVKKVIAEFLEETQKLLQGRNCLNANTQMRNEMLSNWKIRRLDKIAVVTAKRNDYMRFLWNLSLILALKWYKT